MIPQNAVALINCCMTFSLNPAGDHDIITMTSLCGSFQALSQCFGRLLRKGFSYAMVSRQVVVWRVYFSAITACSLRNAFASKLLNLDRHFVCAHGMYLHSLLVQILAESQTANFTRQSAESVGVNALVSAFATITFRLIIILVHGVYLLFLVELWQPSKHLPVYCSRSLGIWLEVSDAFGFDGLVTASSGCSLFPCCDYIISLGLGMFNGRYH